jgi:RNA polymerase sigma-70 factor (ECF subfamily)
LDLIRSRKSKKRFGFMQKLFGDGNEPLHELPDFNHPGVKLDQKENAARLFKAISELPENQRIAFTLHKLESLSYQEVSEVMKTTVPAVESLMHRAKQNLRKMLEKEIS